MPLDPAAQSNLETETTLLVQVEDPEAFRASFAAMDRIGVYALSPVDPLIIEDVYLDTASGDLSKQWWVLRVRTENSSTYITLKGPARRTVSGGAQRIEIEQLWSQESVERVLDTIAGLCPGVELPAVTVGDAPAVATLTRCGFVVSQERHTRRDRRLVLSAHNGGPVAELVLDLVAYQFGTREIRHLEIEVEAASPAHVEHTTAIADGLLAAFGPVLRPWNFGKVATGKALETLLCNGELEGLIGQDNHLLPVVYGLIESRMRER
jgi:inorganic triphosphatase YgiF